MYTIRFAYATQFLIAVPAILEAWSQVGGQSHLDLLPWQVKGIFALCAAFAIVKATAAAVSQEQAWNGRTLRWLGILLVVLAGCGLASYYSHMNLEEQPEEQTDGASSVGELKLMDHEFPFDLGPLKVHQKTEREA